jgi:hypothetical protein
MHSAKTARSFEGRPWLASANVPAGDLPSGENEISYVPAALRFGEKAPFSSTL